MHPEACSCKGDTMKNGKISVMFLVTRLGGGGAEQQLMELVRGIDKERFLPTVVSLYPGGVIEPEVKKIPGMELYSVNRKGKFDLQFITRIIKLLRRQQVDIIQPFITPATCFGMLAALIARTPVKIVTERSGGSLQDNFGQSFYRKAEDFLSRYADWIIPNSGAGRNVLVKRGIAPDRIKVIYNGINTERVNPGLDEITRIQSTMKLAGNERVVGITANLNPVKDHVTFLKGAMIVHREMPETRFAILGDGPLRDELEGMVKELSMESYVTFFGHQRDIASYIYCFDVACLCSHYSEGCSNAILEAMALGKPVVASNVGGNQELVEHGKTGFLVPAWDPQALADSVLTCLRQADLSRKMGQRSRDIVKERFSLARMVSDYEKLYERSLELKRR